MYYRVEAITSKGTPFGTRLKACMAALPDFTIRTHSMLENELSFSVVDKATGLWEGIDVKYFLALSVHFLTNFLERTSSLLALHTAKGRRSPAHAKVGIRVRYDVL